MTQGTGPVPILFLGGTDVGERCYTVDLERKFPGPHELRFVIGDQGPLPLPSDLAPVAVRLSLDGGENWWEGEAKVAAWSVEKTGQRIGMYGTFAARAEPMHQEQRVTGCPSCGGQRVTCQDCGWPER